MLLAEAVEAYDLARMTQVRPATRRGYLQRYAVLIEYFGSGRDVDTITATEVSRWVVSLTTRREKYKTNAFRPTVRGSLSPHTIKTYVQAARALFTWLVSQKVLSASPAVGIAGPPLPDASPKAIYRSDEEKLLVSAQGWSERDFAIVLVFMDTGCRRGGLVSLTVDALELDCPHPRAEITEKGERTRFIYFREETVAALRHYLDVRPVSSYRALFLGRSGTPLTGSGIYQILKRTAARAKVKGRHNPHGFRHAFARDTLTNGADLATTSQLLGHRGVDVTAKYYARFTTDELAVRHEQFSPLANRHEDNELLSTDEQVIVKSHPSRAFLRRVK